MLSSAIFPTVLIDQRALAQVGSGTTPLPVARSIGVRTGQGDLHLVDGDGASLCEAFTQQQLERLSLAWAEVVAGARCPVCAFLGSPSAGP